MPAKPSARADDAEAETQDAALEATSLPSRRLRWVLSAVILWHLWAVLGEPVEFITRVPMTIDGSPAGRAFNLPVKAYSEMTYLNHGYAFFAPDPGPSHLMEVRLAVAAADKDSPGGEPTREIYPDLQRQWPRLLYHRHFMLSEFLNNVYSPPVPPELASVRSDETIAWRRVRSQYDAIRDSFRRHAASRAGVDVQQVTIARIEHRAPFVPEYLQDRVRLRDPRLYTELPEHWSLPPGQAGEPGVPGVPRPLQREPSAQRASSPAPPPEWTPLGVPEPTRRDQPRPRTDAPRTDSQR